MQTGSLPGNDTAKSLWHMHPPCTTFSGLDTRWNLHREHGLPHKPAVSQLAKKHDAMVLKLLTTLWPNIENSYHVQQKCVAEKCGTGQFHLAPKCSIASQANGKRKTEKKQNCHPPAPPWPTLTANELIAINGTELLLPGLLSGLHFFDLGLLWQLTRVPTSHVLCNWQLARHLP